MLVGRKQNAEPFFFFFLDLNNELLHSYMVEEGSLSS